MFGFVRGFVCRISTNNFSLKHSLHSKFEKIHEHSVRVFFGKKPVFFTTVQCSLFQVQ